MVNGRRKGLVFEGRDKELRKDIQMDAPRISNEDFKVREKMFVAGDLLPRSGKRPIDVIP